MDISISAELYINRRFDSKCCRSHQDRRHSKQSPALLSQLPVLFPVSASDSGSSESLIFSSQTAIQPSETELVSSSLNSEAAPFLPATSTIDASSLSAPIYVPIFTWTGPPIVTNTRTSTVTLNTITPQASLLGAPRAVPEKKAKSKTNTHAMRF